MKDAQCAVKFCVRFHVVMVNFMKISWRENVIEIFTLKFFISFTMWNFSTVHLHRIKK